MWNIAICDDEQDMCAELQNALCRFEQECGEALQLTFYHNAEALLAHFPGNTDILLLDIRMGEISGMAAARKLREDGHRLPIIFITTMSQYAIEGYSVHAFGFLKKPIQYEQLKIVLNDAIRNLRKTQGSMVQLEWNGQVTKVKTKDILYAEAYGHQVEVHLADGSAIPCASSLAELETALEKNGFYRGHKSYLVNFECVQKIDQTLLTLSNGETLPLSKHRRKAFRIAFTNYCGGHIL